MENKKDGGPAFPYYEFEQVSGMSLRDYFAAKAMQGIMSKQGLKSALVGNGDVKAAVATMSYNQADVMLKEREK